MIKKPGYYPSGLCFLSVVIQLSISTPSAAHTTPPRSAARPENQTADDPGQNKVQREQAIHAREPPPGMIEAQPPDAERQPAEYP